MSLTLPFTIKSYEFLQESVNAYDFFPHKNQRKVNESWVMCDFLYNVRAKIIQVDFSIVPISEDAAVDSSNSRFPIDRWRVPK